MPEKVTLLQRLCVFIANFSRGGFKNFDFTDNFKIDDNVPGKRRILPIARYISAFCAQCKKKSE